MNPNDLNQNQVQTPQFFNPAPAPSSGKKTVWIIVIAIIIVGILVIGGIYVWGKMMVDKELAPTQQTSLDEQNATENADIAAIENDLASSSFDLSSEFTELEKTF